MTERRELAAAVERRGKPCDDIWRLRGKNSKN